MDSSILKKSSNGLTTIRLDTYLLSERKIFITDTITKELACEVVGKMMFLVMEDPDSPMDILIDSPGGDFAAGMTIYDYVQSCRTPIRMINIGMAHSMAAILLASGKNGRYLLPHAEVMIHDPYVENCPGGSSAALKQSSDRLEKTRKEVHRLMALHTGKTPAQIRKALSFDHFLDASAAISFGICDGVIGMDEIMGRPE